MSLAFAVFGEAAAGDAIIRVAVGFLTQVVTAGLAHVTIAAW